jgi:carboxylesterase
VPVQPPVVAGAEPYAADGTGETGRIGVLASHGFTGSPFSMRPWAQHLADNGYTVRLPRLPGHGTTWQDLNSTKWTDWYAEVRRSYAELDERCDTIVGCGLSMGAALMLRLAEETDAHAKLAGLVLVNPAIAIMRKDAKFAKYLAWAVRSRPGIGNDIKLAGVTEHGYDQTPLKAFVSMQQMWKLIIADLAKIEVPILYLHSTEDHVVDPLSGQLLHAGATNTTVTEVALENSYHVATLDHDAQLIFDQSVQFIQQHAPAGRS